MGGIAAALTLAACGSGNGSSGAAAVNGPASSGPPAAAQSGGTTGDGAIVTTNMLMAKQTKALGKIVTDHKGYILYRYGKDMKSMSMCTGACTEKWLPLMAGATPQVMGVNQQLVGSFTRADGMKQLTLAGWPLYRYAADTKPGEWKGQGMGGVWHAVTPAGKMATKGKTGSTPGGADSGKDTSMPGMDMGG
jgi:predicted lipoprotein with Yx(FWY)xxD motif